MYWINRIANQSFRIPPSVPRNAFSFTLTKRDFLEKEDFASQIQHSIEIESESMRQTEEEEEEEELKKKSNQWNSKGSQIKDIVTKYQLKATLLVPIRPKFTFDFMIFIPFVSDKNQEDSPRHLLLMFKVQSQYDDVDAESVVWDSLCDSFEVCIGKVDKIDGIDKQIVYITDQEPSIFSPPHPSA